MYYFLSLLAGISLSVMVAINGDLSRHYGLFMAAVIVHFIGLLIVISLLLPKRERPFSKKHAWYLYIGGAIGVFVTMSQLFSFGRISITSIMALGLFGQSFAGLIVDQYGLMNMPSRPISSRKLIGLFLVLCGIASMTSSFDALAMAVSFLSGILIVISRTTNARLANLSSVRVSAFFNYFVGLFATILALLLFGRTDLTTLINLGASSSVYIYFGGVLGLAVVLINNVVVAKISAFYLTLLIFIGQVFTGLLIDIVVSQEFLLRNMIGGILVTVGLCINLLMDYSKIQPLSNTK